MLMKKKKKQIQITNEIIQNPFHSRSNGCANAAAIYGRINVEHATTLWII